MINMDVTLKVEKNEDGEFYITFNGKPLPGFFQSEADGLLGYNCTYPDLVLLQETINVKAGRLITTIDLRSLFTLRNRMNCPRD